MRRFGNSRRIILAGSVSALALGASGFCAAAWAADDNSTASDGTTVGEVVVTGQRASLKSSQQIKRDSDRLVDSITAVDIGALPDRSVSEALQRIPGVTLQRTNENRDPARLAAEGGGVFIRGLSWVRSETNGRDIFSANNGRGLSFEDVSADLLAGVDVYKNPGADQVEGGIGGIVNLRTRLPFDSSKRLMAFSADYNYADLRKQGYTSANALFSDRWSTPIGEVGLLVSASVGNVGNRTDSIQTGRYEARTLGVAQDGHAAGSTVYIPNSLGWRRIDWQQKRTAFAGALQWSPNDQWDVTLQALYVEADPKDIEHALGDVQGDFPTDNTTYHFDSQGVLKSGTVNNVGIDADTRYGESHKTTGDYSLHVAYTPNDKWAMSGDFQFVTSHADVLSMTAFTQLGGNRPTLAFNLSGNTPVITETQSPNVMATQSAYWWAAAMDHIEDNDAKSKALRYDVEYTFDDNDWVKSFRMGVRGTNKTAITRQTGYNWSLLSNQYWGNGGGAPVYLNSTGFDASHQDPALPQQSSLFGYNNFFRGDVAIPGVAWFPADALVSNGTANAYAHLKNTESSGWGWSPLTGYGSATPGADNPNGGINNQKERTLAVYGLLRFGHDSSLLGPFDGNIGGRLVETHVEGTGVLTIGSLNGTPATCAATIGAAACGPFNAAYAFAQGGSVPGFKQTNTYHDFLPSFNIRFHLRDDLQLRFAVAQAIVRPSFSQMMPYTTLSFTFLSNGFTPDPVSPLTGTGGNPKLRPTRSNQFDTSLEWYFAPTGSLTFAAFYKDVSDYIFLGQSAETYTSNGQTLTFQVTRNLNGSHGTIKGFELAYQQFYDFLPGAFSGLGLQANFTYVDSNGGKNTAVNILEPAQVAGAGDQTLPLEGLSKTSYNVTVMYEKYGLSARLAYNWRERYLLTTSAANIQRPVWSEDYGQLDGSVFYTVTPNVKIGLQATNILNSRTYLDVGGVSLAPRYSWTDTDRRIAMALRASF